MWFNMITLLFAVLIASVQTVQAHKVVESTEYIAPPETNVTHLYPIHLNITSLRNENKEEKSIANEEDSSKPNSVIHTKLITPNREIIKHNEDPNTEIINTHDSLKLKPSYKTTWKIDAGFAESNIAEDNNVENKNISEEFRPSQLLGYTLEEVTQTNIYKGFSPAVIKPSPEFVSSPAKESYPTNEKPKEIQAYKPFPYKFDSYTKPKGSWSHKILDAEPTEEIPVKLPAGGLYQFPDVFNEHTGLSVSHEHLGYELNQGFNEHFIKKRTNPWKKLLDLITAFIPAGLIISALTPSLINISPASANNNLPKLRRSDTNMQEIQPISENCRRRLLCELHSDSNYSQYGPTQNHRRKQCFKLLCEDTRALFQVLRWLLSFHRPGDYRGRHLT